MHERTEIFIEYFNKLEEALAYKLNRKSHVPFSHMVYDLSEKDAFIKRHKSLLESFGDLRNVLVHKEGNTIIAIPTEEAVAMLKKVVEAYTEPKQLYKLIQQKVETVQVSSSLAEALTIMKANEFSKIPVYNHEVFVGLLSGNILSKWLYDHVEQDGSIHQQLKNITLDHVIETLGKGHDVAFIPRDMDVVEFMSMDVMKRPKSGIYIMTEHGKSSQKPIGIVTAYDYPKLAEMIELG